MVTYRKSDSTHPHYLHPDYKSTMQRAPALPLLAMPQTLSEITGPLAESGEVGAAESDLTKGHGGDPQGERIIVAGRIVDEDDRPIAGTIVELWQCNAAGRYHHPVDQHAAPLDPHFTGVGRSITDDQGGYRFVTIKPGAYPWRNHPNAWRPAHLHFSLFGPAFATRLITQMFFPGDPLLAHDPILGAVPQAARGRLVADFDFALTEPEWALGYSFDIVLRGRRETPTGI